MEVPEREQPLRARERPLRETGSIGWRGCGGLEGNDPVVEKSAIGERTSETLSAAQCGVLCRACRRRARLGIGSLREVIILGQVKGNVETSDKVDIRKDAKLEGNITTARISIEDGALFKGSIDIKKAEPKVAAPAPTPAAARPAEPYNAPAAGAAGAMSATAAVKR